MSVMSVDEIKRRLEVIEQQAGKLKAAELEHQRERRLKRVIAVAFWAGAFVFALVGAVMLLAVLVAIKFLWEYLWL